MLDLHIRLTAANPKRSHTEILGLTPFEVFAVMVAYRAVGLQTGKKRRQPDEPLCSF